MLVMEFVHEEMRVRCPNHLRRLLQTAAVTFHMPNIVHSVSAVTLPSSLTLHVHQTIDLVFWRSHCKSGATDAQVSLPCNRAECTLALKTFPGVLRDKSCFDVSTGSILLALNAPIAVYVACFSHLLKRLRSLYGKQCAIGAVCSGSTLFTVYRRK